MKLNEKASGNNTPGKGETWYKEKKEHHRSQKDDFNLFLLKNILKYIYKVQSSFIDP